MDLRVRENGPEPYNKSEDEAYSDYDIVVEDEQEVDLPNTGYFEPALPIFGRGQPQIQDHTGVRGRAHSGSRVPQNKKPIQARLGPKLDESGRRVDVDGAVVDDQGHQSHLLSVLKDLKHNNIGGFYSDGSLLLNKQIKYKPKAKTLIGTLHGVISGSFYESGVLVIDKNPAELITDRMKAFNRSGEIMSKKTAKRKRNRDHCLARHGNSGKPVYRLDLADPDQTSVTLGFQEGYNPCAPVRRVRGDSVAGEPKRAPAATPTASPFLPRKRPGKRERAKFQHH